MSGREVRRDDFSDAFQLTARFVHGPGLNLSRRRAELIPAKIDCEFCASVTFDQANLDDGAARLRALAAYTLRTADAFERGDYRGAEEILLSATFPAPFRMPVSVTATAELLAFCSELIESWVDAATNLASEFTTDNNNEDERTAQEIEKRRAKFRAIADTLTPKPKGS